MSVSDQDEALASYRDVLGFEVRDDQAMGEDMRRLTVAPIGAETALVLASGYGGARRAASPASSRAPATSRERAGPRPKRGQ